MGCEYTLEAEDVLPQFPEETLQQEEPDQTQTTAFSFTPADVPPSGFQIVRVRITL